MVLCNSRHQGTKIKDAGGLMKFNVNSMTDEQKIHKLLEFMWTTDKDRYDWDASSLMPAFQNVLNEYEVKHLCRMLIKNGDVRANETKDGFSIGFIDESKSAFHVKKYLRSTQQPIVNITTGDIGTIQKNYGTVGGAMNQVSDSDLKNSFKALNKPNIKNNAPSKSKISNTIVYPILVGVILIIIALVLKYGFGITY